MVRLAGALAVLIGMAQASLPAPVPAVRVTQAARAIQPGEIVVLTVVTTDPATSLQVRAFGQAFPAYSVDVHTWKVLVGIDLGVQAGTHPVSISAAGPKPARTTHSLQVKSRTFPTRTLTVDPNFVNPPAEALDRIQRDQAELETVWRSSSVDRLWQDAFVRPVPDESNSAFGSRSIFNGQARSPHGGADFLSPTGRPVAAPNGGRVALAKDLYYTGNTVILDHGLGLFSMFAHLSALNVKEGDVVTTGQVVGEVGATGRVTGPHLHWAVRLAGARVDPLSLLAVVK